MEVLTRRKVVMGAAGSGGTRLVKTAVREGLRLDMVVDRMSEALERLRHVAHEVREHVGDRGFKVAPFAQLVQREGTVGKISALVDNLDTVARIHGVAVRKKVPSVSGAFVFPLNRKVAVGIVSVFHPDAGSSAVRPHPVIQVCDHPALRGVPAGDGEFMNPLSASMLPSDLLKALDQMRDGMIHHLFLDDGKWAALARDGHGVVLVEGDKLVWQPVYPEPLRERPEMALEKARREGMVVATPRGLALPDGSWMKIVEHTGNPLLWNDLREATWERQIRRELEEIRRAMETERTRLWMAVDRLLSTPEGLFSYPACE